MTGVAVREPESVEVCIRCRQRSRSPFTLAVVILLREFALVDEAS
jgi:hypothetical protein